MMVMPNDLRELIQWLAFKMNICHISGEIIPEAKETLLKSTLFVMLLASVFLLQRHLVFPGLV